MSRITLKKSERGQSVIEFVAGLPLFILLAAGLGILSVFFWSLGMMDTAAAQGARDASLWRGGGNTLTAGYSAYTATLSNLAGSEALSAASPKMTVAGGMRQVQFALNGGMHTPINAILKFTSGAASRLHNFYPGPPDPWE